MFPLSLRPTPYTGELLLFMLISVAFNTSHWKKSWLTQSWLLLKSTGHFLFTFSAAYSKALCTENLIRKLFRDKLYWRTCTRLRQTLAYWHSLTSNKIEYVGTHTLKKKMEKHRKIYPSSPQIYPILPAFNNIWLHHSLYHIGFLQKKKKNCFSCQLLELKPKTTLILNMFSIIFSECSQAR